MPLRLHVCTLPADKRVYQEHLKVTTNNALQMWQKSPFWLKFRLVYRVKIADRYFKACVLKYVAGECVRSLFIVMPPFSQCINILNLV